MDNLERPNIYITQIPYRRDRDTGTLVPAINVAPAEEYGAIQVLLPPQAPFIDSGRLVPALEEGLEDYDFFTGDALIPLGDPVVIATACAILGRKHGRFHILKWDRNTGRYLRVAVDIT